MAENIIIKQEYFDNIKTAINGLNEFFSSGFKVKNFPSVDGDIQLESTLERIISRLDGVDPTWMEDANRVNDIINTISENIKNINPVDGVYETIVNSNNETLIAAIDAYVGFKMLQYIADNFQDFGKFINGIYTFELFTKPSQYTDVMDTFGKFIDLEEVPGLDLEEKIFDEGAFVDGLMKLSQISFPESMTIETETERIINRQDLEGVEIFVDDSVQEAAEINYFDGYKPTHIKYNTKTNKWMISKQFEKTVNDLVAALRKCDTTDDLNTFFHSDFWTKKDTLNVCDTVVPCILTRVFSNSKKFGSDSYMNDQAKKYIDSYKSILDQNNGAKRFQNYDLFSTFKTDKDGTIQFVEDFLKLNLVNKEDVSINNNTLLTLFNIFDSRIYLDIMYNMLPDEKKNEKSEDEFVKEIRARINKNSKSKNAYSDAEVKEDEPVSEYVSRIIDEFTDSSISDMMYCEQFRDAIMAEIDTVDNRIYNAGISPFVIDEYIGESYNDIHEFLDDVFTEANVHKQRENLQSCVSALMAEMERIVELDKKHQWNNNTFVDSYKTTAGLILAPFPNVTASTKAHTDIKQVYKYTRKALKGKSGNLTPAQNNALRRLHDLVGDLWANVKIFWVNPINWPKHMNLLRNDRKQNRVKHIADIARSIVSLKESLEFLQDEQFVNEAWYDGSPDYVFQEASTEQNHERLALSIKILMEDMKSVVDLSKKKMWTNNACISKFNKKSASYTNIKQAIKYVDSGVAGAAGIPKSSDIDTLKTLLVKLKEMLKVIKQMNFGVAKAFNKNIKESDSARKIANLASEILDMKSELDFVNGPAVKGAPSDKSESSDDEVQEATVADIREFITIMEAYDGSIPEYMRARLKMSDDLGTTVTAAPVPNDVPLNDIGDLTDSIDAKLDAGGDLSDMLGSGFENNPNKGEHEGKIVVNITNNYSNSFNKDSGNTNTSTATVDDHSTGKVTNTTHTNSHNNTNSHNDNSHDNRNDSSTRKSESSSSAKSYSDNSKSSNTEGSNNNNNSNGSVDTKDSRITEKDNEQKLSSGKTIQEMFMFLESKEPQSSGHDAGKPPKEDSLTKAMDRDRKTLATQQKGKKGLQKVANTTKAVLKPVTRPKQWLTGVVDSLIRRDEDQVKAEIIENPSYRSMLYKATRLAIHLGLIGVVTTIQPYLGVALVGVEGLRLADRQRLKKEAQKELETEIEIVDEKIRDLDAMGNDKDARKKKYEYMRIKSDLESKLLKTPRSVVKHPRSVW